MKQPTWENKPTKKLSPRPKGQDIEAIILHATIGHFDGDLRTLTTSNKPVSADFLISREGEIVKLNPQLRTHYTWQAGQAELDGHGHVNQRTIGIEQSHMPDEDWPDAQVKACATLCRWLYESGIVKTRHIFSHAFVARPIGRKTDPAGYPWESFSDFWNEAN